MATSPPAGAESVTVEPSGQVRVATGVGTQGQGHYTVFAQVVAEVLGVDVTDVRVVTGDTREFQWGTGTFASRGAVVAGSACDAAARAVREKILTLAAQLLGVAATELELADGRVFVRADSRRGFSLAELAAKANPLRGAVRPGTEPGLESTAYFAPSQRDFMINYRVENLERLVEQLKEEGVTIVDEIESFDYGKFVHILDGEGNKIELWEPSDTEYDKIVGGRTK